MAILNWEIENKAYDEVKLGDKTYKLYFDDESLDKYRKQANKYAKDAKALSEIDADKLTEEEIVKLQADSNQTAKEFIEAFCGNGSYEEIFDACGRSSFNLIKIVDNIREWLQTKYKTVENANASKYKTKRK